MYSLEDLFACHSVVSDEVLAGTQIHGGFLFVCFVLGLFLFVLFFFGGLHVNWTFFVLVSKCWGQG